MFGRHYHARTRMPWIILVGIVVAALLLSGCGAQKPKVYHVGILCGVESQIPISDSFKARMTELGYVEGQNIVYDFEVSTDADGQQSIVKKFVADKVDLIFAFPDGSAIAAKAATAGTNIPVIFASSFSELNDLVESVRTPGGNITGVRVPGPEITIKTEEILLKLLPDTKRIWVAYDPDYAPNILVLEASRPVAASLGVTLVEVQVKSAADVKADLQARGASEDVGIDAMMLIADIITRTPEAFGAIIEFGNEHKIPVAGGSRNLVPQGTIFSVTTDHIEQGKLAATLADKIFKGASAGTLPVYTPDTILIFNYKVAQGLGITVPDSILSQAEEIIR